MESDKTRSVGKKVKIYFDKFKYEGILLYEDDVIYRIDDRIEGKINLPKGNCVMKEVEE